MFWDTNSSRLAQDRVQAQGDDEHDDKDREGDPDVCPLTPLCSGERTGADGCLRPADTKPPNRAQPRADLGKWPLLLTTPRPPRAHVSLPNPGLTRTYPLGPWRRRDQPDCPGKVAASVSARHVARIRHRKRRFERPAGALPSDPGAARKGRAPTCSFQRWSPQRSQCWRMRAGCRRALATVRELRFTAAGERTDALRLLLQDEEYLVSNV